MSDMVWTVQGKSVVDAEMPEGCSKVVESRGSTFPYACTRNARYIMIVVETHNRLGLYGYCQQHKDMMEDLFDGERTFYKIPVK